MRHILAIGVALFSLSLAASAGAEDSQSPPKDHTSAGLCVLLDNQGRVLDARLAQTSGDPKIDEDAVELARKLQWAPPYPEPGWLGVRITLGAAPGPTSPQDMPHCGSTPDPRFKDAI